MVQKGVQPWKTAFDNLKEHTSLAFTPEPFVEISVGPYGANSIGGREFSESAEAAYNHALMWYITRNKTYARKSIEILNAWSYVLRGFDANNAKLNVGLFGYYYLNAAEILKYTDAGWTAKDIEQFTQMVLTVLYPTIKDFFTEANGNWDASIISTMMCIGIFTDNHEIFNRAVERFHRGGRKFRHHPVSLSRRPMPRDYPRLGPCATGYRRTCQSRPNCSHTGTGFLQCSRRQAGTRI